MIAFDQRWHGRGIRSPRFTFADCADDVAALMDELGVEQAIIAGYSMGGAIAQLVWHQHPEKVVGLVLCSTARNFRGLKREKFFFPVLTAVTQVLAGHAHSRVEQLAATLPEVPSMDRSDPSTVGEGRVPQHQRVVVPRGARRARPLQLGELDRRGRRTHRGGGHERDHTIPQRRQRKLAESIEGASLYTAPGGHASIVLRAGSWLPRFREALADVTRRAEFDVRSPRTTATG